MLRVCIESPFGTRPDGTRASPEEVARNVRYLHRCILDSLRRGEAPYASHRFFPGILDDATPEERELGIQAGFAWGAAADLVAIYEDMGALTPGMIRGLERAQRAGQRIEWRHIGAEPNV